MAPKSKPPMETSLNFRLKYPLDHWTSSSQTCHLIFKPALPAGSPVFLRSHHPLPRCLSQKSGSSAWLSHLPCPSNLIKHQILPILTAEHLSLSLLSVPCCLPFLQAEAPVPLDCYNSLPTGFPASTLAFLSSLHLSFIVKKKKKKNRATLLHTTSQ